MSDDQVTALLSQIQALCDRVRFLEADNARLHTRLKAQIEQYGELHRRKLDGEAPPDYVVRPNATGTAVGLPTVNMDGSRDGDYVSPPIIDYGTAGDPRVSRIIP